MNLGGGLLEEDPADATTEGDVIDDESSIERDAMIGIGGGDVGREEDGG